MQATPNGGQCRLGLGHERRSTQPQSVTQRHHLDDTIHWPELRSVDSPAAPNADFQLQADDATSVRKRLL